MEDFQFSLEGMVFGNHTPVFVDAEGFDPGDGETTTQDAVNPRTGARVMGRDVRGAPTWTWAMFTDAEDPEGALALLEEFGGVWHDERWLTEYAELHYTLAGRERVVYGRPRRFSYKPGNAILGGLVPPMATFDLADRLHYSSIYQSVPLQLAPEIPGGFVVPFEAPLAVQVPAGFKRPGQIVVGGNAPTAPVVRFVGPSVNPKVLINGVQVGLQGELAEYAEVQVDARPWRTDNVRRTGNAYNVTLDTKTRLSELRLKPGAYEAVYSATDTSGQSSASVGWRDAYRTI